MTLHHPSMAKPGDRLVGAFALRVGGRGTHDSEALLAGISTRLRAEGGWEPWQVTIRARGACSS